MTSDHTTQDPVTGTIPAVPPGETAVLTVDLAAIAHNYEKLREMASGAECAAVVKADAYGTGANEVAATLSAHGCRTFFVATLSEAVALRAHLDEARIFVLDGLFPGAEDRFLEHRLIPVLGSLESLEAWGALCGRTGATHPAALQIDTGMNRLGVGRDAIGWLIERQSFYFRHFKPELIMSHLACADEPDHPRNGRQLDLFRSALSQLPPAPASLANSAGIRLGEEYRFDLVRPGISLYGGQAVIGDGSSGMSPVVSLVTRIAQIREVEEGDTVGYGATYRFRHRNRLATLPIGYADGYPRALGAGNHMTGASVVVGPYRAPVVGRVSMDLITIDITDIPPAFAHPGATVELLGPHIGVDELAEIAGTIGYELLTSLGRRYLRRHIGA